MEASQLYGVGSYDPVALVGAPSRACPLRRRGRLHSRPPRLFH